MNKAQLRNLLVFGGRSTALEVAETARQLWPDVRVTHVFGDRETMPEEDAVRIGELRSWIARCGGGVAYIVSMADQKLRSVCREHATSLGLEPVSVVHPAAVVSRHARIGAGTYIAACVCVSTYASVAEHCVINFHSVIGHDTKLETNVVVNPAASIGGNVNVGARTLIGANSFIFQGKTIGADVVVDAMTYVDRDVPEASIVSARKPGRLSIVARPGYRRSRAETALRC